MSDIRLPPLPEPAAWQVRRTDYGLWASQYWEACSKWEAENCTAKSDLRELYTADQMHAYLARGSAAKDAEIAQLREDAESMRPVVDAIYAYWDAKRALESLPMDTICAEDDILPEELNLAAAHAKLDTTIDAARGKT